MHWKNSHFVLLCALTQYTQCAVSVRVLVTLFLFLSFFSLGKRRRLLHLLYPPFHLFAISLSSSSRLPHSPDNHLYPSHSRRSNRAVLHIRPIHGIIWHSGCVAVCVSLRECFCTDRMCVCFKYLSSVPLKVSEGVWVEVRELKEGEG